MIHIILFIGVIAWVIWWSVIDIRSRRESRPHRPARGAWRAQPTASAIFLDEDPYRLCYCQGCGCRHRQMYMDWKPEGTYRCGVCCGDYANRG